MLEQHLNSNTNLSLRSVGKLLHCSHNHAKKQLTKLKAFGLTTKSNVVRISEKVHAQLKGSCSLRYDKENKRHLFVASNIITIDRKKVNPAFYKVSSFSYCDI